MDEREYEIMYRIEDGFWWYRGLHGWLRAELARARTGPVFAHLDAGCGTGRLLSLCDDHFTFGIDFSEHALAFTRRRGRFPLARASVTALPFCDGAFDAVTSADVLSEVGSPGDEAALAEFARVLKPGGRVILNLPAYAWLASRHDAAVNTRRRYRAGEVAALLAQAGFTVRTLTYRLCALLPPIALVRLAGRIRASAEAPRSDLEPAPRAIDALLSHYLQLENRILACGGRLPFGLSVSAVGEKAGAKFRL